MESTGVDAGVRGQEDSLEHSEYLPEARGLFADIVNGKLARPSL